MHVTVYGLCVTSKLIKERLKLLTRAKVKKAIKEIVKASRFLVKK